MDCIEARKKLKEYANDELDTAEQGRIEAHVSGCPVCKRELLMWQEVMEKQRSVRIMQGGMPRELKDKIKYRMNKAEREAAVPPVIKRMQALSGLWGAGKARMILLLVLIMAALAFLLYAAYNGKDTIAPFLFLFGFAVLFALMIFKGNKKI